MADMMKTIISLVVVPVTVVLTITGYIIKALWGLLKWLYGFFKGRKGPTTHGDADWAPDKTLKAKGHFEPKGFLLLVTKSGKRVFTHPEKSVMLLAGPGHGKSQSTLACFHAKALLPEYQRQHLLVFDPANELWTKGAPVLEELGYICGKIDLVNPKEGFRYDIRSFLKPQSENFDIDLKGLCELLVPPEPGSKQPHFVEYARSMLQDVITFDMLHDGGRRSIGDCADLILDDAKRKAMVEKMKRIGGFKAISTFEKMGANEGASMLSTSLRKLDPWTVRAVREISKVTPEPGMPMGWTFEHLLSHEKPCALFVRIGLRPGGGDFARVVFGNAINTIRRSWDDTGQGPSRPVQAFIDEAARLGCCNALVNGHGELRKAGYTQWLSYLGLSAIKDIYGADGVTMFNGSDHLIFPENNDMETNEAYSKMIGDMTIESNSRSEGNHGESKGANEQARRRIKADEIRRSEYEEAFAVLGGLSVRGLKTFKRMPDGKPPVFR